MMAFTEERSYLSTCGSALVPRPFTKLVRAQKNGEDGEKSSRTKPNLMDSLVPKQCIKQTDRQTYRSIQTDSQSEDRQKDT